MGASEAETFWTDFPCSLPRSSSIGYADRTFGYSARRGLRSVKLVISDAHEGLNAAAQRVLRWDTIDGCVRPRQA